MQRLMNERRALGGQLAARVQRKAESAAGEVAIPEGGGTQLGATTRQRFEGKLGADLSDVRVHTGGASAQAASGLGARAFTVGSDVHFNAGEFAPGWKEGDRLLAHELTHVVQGKKAGVQRKAEHDSDGDKDAGGGKHGAGAEVSHPDEPAEKEADAVADGVTESLHGDKDKGKEKDNAKGKDDKSGAKDKDKSSAKHDAHGKDPVHDKDAAHGKDPAHDHGGGAGQHGGDHGAPTPAPAAEGAGGAAAAPAEKPAAISAKYVGVGRKIFRAPGPAAAPKGSATPTPSPSVDPKKQRYDRKLWNRVI